MSAVAVTGLGVIAPNGCGKEEFWNALKEGISGIGPVTRFDASGYPSQVAGEVSLPPQLRNEISNGGGNPNRSLTSEILLAAAHLALKDACISQEEFSRLNSGIWAGTSTTDMGMVEKEYNHFKANGAAKPYFVSSSYPHAAASEIAADLRCLGPVSTVSIGCTSGIFSIIAAAEMILKGEVDVVLAGGGDAPISPFPYSGFCEGGFLTTSFNHFPEGASRPFDARRDGGVLSEGAGMIVLEKAERAMDRNKRIYGYLSGWGKSNAYNYKVMGNAFTLSMTGALKASRITPSEVDYICANAPGDSYIDAVELRAIERFFSQHSYSIPISSIKSTIGNPLAAAGPLQVIASLLAMNHCYVPPTVNLEDPRPNSGLDLVPQKGRVSRLKRVLLNAQGLGGSNVSVTLSSSNNGI